VTKASYPLAAVVNCAVAGATFTTTARKEAHDRFHWSDLSHERSLEVLGLPSTTAPIAKGNRMPPHNGAAVTWQLIQYT
jgi:hypothetical protein